MLSWNSALVQLEGYDEFPTESVPKFSDNVPSIYDVATEGSNVPKGKGASP